VSIFWKKKYNLVAPYLQSKESCALPFMGKRLRSKNLYFYFSNKISTLRSNCSYFQALHLSSRAYTLKKLTKKKGIYNLCNYFDSRALKGSFRKKEARHKINFLILWIKTYHSKATICTAMWEWGNPEDPQTSLGSLD